MLGTQAGDSEQFLTKLKTDTAFLMAQLKKKKKREEFVQITTVKNVLPMG